MRKIKDPKLLRSNVTIRIWAKHMGLTVEWAYNALCVECAIRITENDFNNINIINLRH